MAKNQKKYTQEFKQQLVDLYNTGNYSFPQLSSEYGVAKSTILGWVRNLSPIQVSETETISMKEYKALQKKMRDLEIENVGLNNIEMFGLWVWKNNISVEVIDGKKERIFQYTILIATMVVIVMLKIFKNLT